MPAWIRHTIQSIILSLPNAIQALIRDESIRTLSKKHRYQERVEKYYWDEGSRYWYSFTKPLRPSADDIRLYRSHIKVALAQLHTPKILCMGAVPELRDMLAEFYETADIYVVDFSEAMLTMSTRKLRTAEADREVWIKANWIDVRLPENFFDVIVGDLVLQQFPKASMPVALARIALLLKRNGAFIFRGRVAKETLFGKTTEEVVREVLQSAYESDTEAALTLIWKLRDAYSHLPDASAPNRDSIISDDLEKFTHKEPALKVAKLAHHYLSLSAQRFPFRSFHGAPDAREHQALLSREFAIVREGYATDYHDSAFFPISFVQKKA